MRSQSSVLMCFLLILVIFTAGCTDVIEKEEANQNIKNVTELSLIVVPEKTELEQGEILNINLTLTNIGDNTLNVWKMEHSISYDIFFESLTDNSSATWICGENSVPVPTTGYLVELKSGGSLNSTFNSGCWVLTPGEYMLSSVYHTDSYAVISKPYWRGEVKSNEVLIKVLDTTNNITTPSLIDPPQIIQQ